MPSRLWTSEVHEYDNAMPRTCAHKKNKAEEVVSFILTDISLQNAILTTKVGDHVNTRSMYVTTTAQ